jgi:hypothetical protein
MLVSVSNIDIRLILYKLRELWIGWLHSHPVSGLCTDLEDGGTLTQCTFFKLLYLLLVSYIVHTDSKQCLCTMTTRLKGCVFQSSITLSLEQLQLQYKDLPTCSLRYCTSRSSYAADESQCR